MTTTVYHLVFDDLGNLMDLEIHPTDIVPMELTEEELSNISYYDSIAEEL
jgi:hypothetical protein